jgi:hypothetical protein
MWLRTSAPEPWVSSAEYVAVAMECDEVNRSIQEMNLKKFSESEAEQASLRDII